MTQLEGPGELSGGSGRSPGFVAQLAPDFTGRADSRPHLGSHLRTCVLTFCFYPRDVV